MTDYPEGTKIMVLRDDYYRDGFDKVMIACLGVMGGVVLSAIIAGYFYFDQPPPVGFAAGEEWRVQSPVPLDQPYLNTTDLLQWVSNVLPQVFHYDFTYYNEELKTYAAYFTQNGWRGFLNQLNIYANYNNVQRYKLFINGSTVGAPFILNEGLLSGRYAWWVQMPIDINYTGYERSSTQSLTLQVLVVRVPTLNNLNGIGIDNIIIVKSAGNQPLKSG